MENLNNGVAPTPEKKISWKSCGCGCLVVLFLLLVIAVAGYFINKKGNNDAEDVRKAYLKEDLEKVTANPSQESDSVSFFLKPCVGISIEGIDTDEIKYYTRRKGEKMLVLLKVGDMKDVKKETRKELVFAVEECLEVMNSDDNIKEYYIGVQGNWNMLMVKTPQESDLGGKFADSDLLLPFYDKVKTDASPSDTGEANP